jgi:hypothetical protein
MNHRARPRVQPHAGEKTGRCTACGWRLTILRSHPTARLFHPVRCPCCGSTLWSFTDARLDESRADSSIRLLRNVESFR